MKNLEITKEFGSVMVLVPHEDDEILMAGGLLYEAQHCGVPVTVVMATNGDYECSDHAKARKRLRESIRGCGQLKIAPSQLIFMGYADTGMPAEDSFLMRLYEEKNAERVHLSSCSNHTYALPEQRDYHTQKYQTPALYCRKEFKEDLKQIVAEKRPKHIFTTSEFDTHGDHAALCLFLYEILGELKEESGYSPDVYCGLIHSCEGDESWPGRGTLFFGAPRGIGEKTAYRWEERYILRLPPEMCAERGEENLKRRALLQYKTALEPNAVEFLLAFLKNEEIFWKVRNGEQR
ncbi:MAG: PIG-L family deacetylase [Eubacteriales bacterium]|nr:PIG-L family deacetylase [Eubacteriales bacterium]